MHSNAGIARVAGFIYLILTIVGVFSLIYVPGVIIVHGNPAATAANIVGHETLLRLGIVGELVGITLELAAALVLYRLLVSVDKVYAQLMLILGGILPIPIYFMNAMNWVGALLLATGGAYASAFSATERDALIVLFINLHRYGFMASEVFAGLWLLPMGVLIYRSGFLPRFLGVWLVISGLAYLVDCFCGFLLPQFQDAVAKVAFPLELGEVATMLWLLVMGAKESRPALQPT